MGMSGSGMGRRGDARRQQASFTPCRAESSRGSLREPPVSAAGGAGRVEHGCLVSSKPGENRKLKMHAQRCP